jgi:hypothetical protein
MKKLFLIAGLLWASAAKAQFTPGQVLTATELNGQFALYAALAGATFTGPVTTADLSSSGTISGVGFANLLSPYLLSATANTTYAPITGSANYAPAMGSSVYSTIANLALKAPISSPTFTGAVTIPMGASISGFAPLASPTFTGTATFANITASGTLTGFPGRLLNVQRFTANGTYTPTTGTHSGLVYVLGGGGAGGGAPATSTLQQSCGSGGGSGALGVSYITSIVTETITVGAGGTGVSGAAGNAGGQSSFGGLITAPGGGGGPAAGPAATTTSVGAGPGVGGSEASGATLVNTPGQPSTTCMAITGAILNVSNGASSIFGSGGLSTFQGTGGLSGGFGSGGGGTGNAVSQSAITGGAGAAGVVIIFEYQ